MEQINHEVKVTVGLNKSITAIGLVKFDLVFVSVLFSTKRPSNMAHVVLLCFTSASFVSYLFLVICKAILQPCLSVNQSTFFSILNKELFYYYILVSELR